MLTSDRRYLGHVRILSGLSGRSICKKHSLIPILDVDQWQGMRDSVTYRLEQPPVPDELRSRLNSRHITPPAAARGIPIRDHSSPQARVRRAADRCCIFVGNLPSAVTQEQLAEIFGSYGRINGIEVISKPSTNGKLYGCLLPI